MKIVIVGAGEVGFHIASHLALENKDVVVVDTNSDALRRVAESLDVQVMEGSGSSPLVLMEAGVQKADILLAVTNSDETNLVACLMADILSPTTKKLARVRNADFDGYHDTFSELPPHIDTLINPEIEVVKTIVRMMNYPGTVDVVEFADGRLNVVGLYLDATSALDGMRLIDLPAHTGDRRLLIAGLVREENLIIPRGNDRLKAGDLVYFIAESDKLADALSLFDKPVEPLNRVLVVGGGNIGYRLASQLEQQGISCKIIEKRADRCAKLAENLNKTIVLHGDGSDQSLLAEENIQDIDVVVTLTNDEETNILVSLLTRRMGAKNCITRISKFSYFPLMATIGIEQVVSPRLSAVNSILQHIRRGKVVSAFSIKGENAEVMEAEALETSDIVSRPLMQIGLPKGSLVIGISRGEQTIVPTGQSVIEPGDRIIIFAHRTAIPKIEKILSVKLEYF
ncbi:MAG: Trk system potassium transporter TrkA [Desulfobacterales bacterium]